MDTANSPIDLPVLRVDSAVWQRASGPDECRLTAHLTLGDVTVRLEATALDGDEGTGSDSTYAQRTRIGDRSYLVIGYEDEPRRLTVAGA